MNSLTILLFIYFIIVGLISLGKCSLGIHNSLQSLEDKGLLNNTLSIETLMQTSKDREMALEKAQKVNRNFERLIQLVNILGQVDTFLSERTKSMMRKLALLAQDDDGYYRRRRS